MSETKEYFKVPLFVEIIGEPSTGKTHLSCLFPKPALFDTTAKGEAYAILMKLCPEECKNMYFRVRTFDDIALHLNYITANKNFFSTVIIDTAADLRGLAINKCLEELKKVKPERERLMPEEYSCVNEKVNNFIDSITDPNGKYVMNLVFTAQMKDEWVKRESTGRRIRDGHPKANFQCDLRFYLQLKQKVDPKSMQYLPNEYERVCQIIKCRFRNQTDKAEWIPELKELTWAKIKELTKLEEGEIVE